MSDINRNITTTRRSARREVSRKKCMHGLHRGVVAVSGETCYVSMKTARATFGGVVLVSRATYYVSRTKCQSYTVAMGLLSRLVSGRC